MHASTSWIRVSCAQKKEWLRGGKNTVGEMSAPLSRSALCVGDPDAFASEMIKMINDKEFRYKTSLQVQPESCKQIVSV